MPLDVHAIATVCSNPECGYYGSVRTIAGQHLGQGIYLTGVLTCGCGTEVHVVSEDKAAAVEVLMDAEPTKERLLEVLQG